MSLFLRIFSSDYRAGVAAEAAGDFKRAAQLYALANAKNKVAEMHLLRKDAASGDHEEIELFRAAVRWAEPGTEIARVATEKLARALLSKTQSQGVKTERDRRLVREAADLFKQVEDFRRAGEIYESLDDDEAAGHAYGLGGLVEKMETALARVTERSESERRVREAFQGYEAAYQSGNRPAARAALRTCVDVAKEKGDYARLHDQLETRWLAAGFVRLRYSAPAKELTVCGVKTVRIGRDSDCELSLRAPNVSRKHAAITIENSGGRSVFTLQDTDSRAGTWLGDMPVSGRLPLEGTGRLSLGKECTLDFSTQGETLLLGVSEGLDQGWRVLCGPPNVAIDIEPTTGMPATLCFTAGMPVLSAKQNRTIILNGQAILAAATLIREDLVRIGEMQVTVL